MSRCEGPWWAPCGCQTIWQGDPLQWIAKSFELVAIPRTACCLQNSASAGALLWGTPSSGHVFSTISAVGSGRKPSGINVMSKRLWNPWGFGVKSVSITSGWPSSLVSKGYEFAASCACPGSSHHTGRLGLLGTEARRHPILWHTHQGCMSQLLGKPQTLPSPPMAW